jgi:hypothetical protein
MGLQEPPELRRSLVELAIRPSLPTALNRNMIGAARNLVFKILVQQRRRQLS